MDSHQTTKTSTSNHGKMIRDFLKKDLTSEGSGSTYVVNFKSLNPDQTESSSTIIPEGHLTLSKTKEKKLLKEFGIVHSTSTTIVQRRENKKVPKRPTKKRRIILSASSKKMKKSKKVLKIKKPKNVKKLSTLEKRKQSGTFIIEKADHFHEVSWQTSVLPPNTLDIVNDSILDLTLDEYDATLEHDSVATKYGLPYEIIQCACYLKDEVFGKDETPDPVCISQSCYNFEQMYGRRNQASEYTEDVRSYDDFKEACEIHMQITQKYSESMDEDEFLKARSFLEVFYPHYWKHISLKYVMYLCENDIAKEKFSKTQVVLSCMRLLKEQELLSKHYRMKMRGLEDGLAFGDRLNHNYNIACSFLKKEYASLFVYLIKKYSFNDLVCQKMRIIRNRLRVVKKSRKSQKELKRLNAKYKREDKKK